MKKLFSTIFATLLSLSLILTGFTFTVQADDLITETEKISCNATLDDNFADNRVLVVLTREASLEFNTYTANSFASLGCTKVTDLSTATGAMARTAMEQATSMLYSNHSRIVSTKHTESISRYNQILCLQLDQHSKENVLDVIAALEKQEGILYAGPDYYINFDLPVPQEILIEGSSSVVGDRALNNDWAVEKIELPAAQALVTNPSTVLVGIIDGGIDGDHPELQDAINGALCRNFSSGTAVVENPPVDYTGHGTQVAGIIAGQDEVTGVCPSAQIVSLNVRDANGNGTDLGMIMAINYAQQIGLDVLNVSASVTYSSSSEMTPFANAVENYSGILVCAAGNMGTNIDGMYMAPTNLSNNNVIVVGSTDRLDIRYYTSNYGPATVDLFAPGVMVLTAMNGGGITQVTGTSFASPYVAGVAALLLSFYPDMAPINIKYSILTNVDIVSSAVDKCVSDGRLNAYSAINNAHAYCQFSAYENEDVFTHCRTCSICGYVQRDAHTWTEHNGRYRCHLCLAITNNIPEIINSIIPGLVPNGQKKFDMG